MGNVVQVVSDTYTPAVEDPQEIELTVLMPCLDEAETIEVCVRKAVGYLESSGVVGEVLIADNGSTDGSQALAEAACARVVGVAEKGYGAALIGGIAAARGKYVIMGDADDSYDFSQLGAFVDGLRGGADVVMGNRFRGGIEAGAMPFLHRFLGNPVLSFIGRLFFDIPVGDFHCGLRGFNKTSILDLKLKSPGMEFASEMVVKAALNGLNIQEVPTTLSPDGRSRAPHLKTWRDGWRHLRFLLMHSPRWLFAYPGAALLALGLLGAGLLFSGPIQITHSISLDTHTLIAACFCAVAGVQLIFFSVLSRAYAAAEGFLPKPERMGRVIMGLNLERTLQLALVLFLLGASGVVWSVLYWAGLGFGQINESSMLRVFVPSLMLLTISVQVAASAFLWSIFSIRQ